MKQQERLAILVKSDQYFDFVEKLAQAAFQKRRLVKIHIMGDGVALLWESSFDRLLDLAQISVCGESVAQFQSQKIADIPNSVAVVSPEKVSALIQWGDRNVVF
jgi:hypothetical protein